MQPQNDLTNESNVFKDFNLPKRKSINILDTLLHRELGCPRREIRHNQIKKFYHSIHPNFTVLNVKTPNCFLRRFSPCGRYLIAYNNTLSGIIIYQFEGSASGCEALSALKNYTHAEHTDLGNNECEQIRSRIFDLFFTEKKNLKLIDNNEFINRECALFYSNDYLIVASSEVVNDDAYPSYDQIAQNNESIAINPIENYTFFLVDMKNYRLSDKITFKYDKIAITHNQGLGLYKNVFAVLSQQQQQITVYLLKEENSKLKFIQKYQIGRFCSPDDSEYFHTPYLNQLKQDPFKHNKPYHVSLNNTEPEVKPFAEKSFCSLKHRILSFFYREAVETNTLNQFYMYVNGILDLKMHKMQLLDDEHLFIKYANHDFILNQKSTTVSAATQNAPGGNPSALNEHSVTFFFVLYNMRTCQILNIFRNNSRELMNAYQYFQDFFTLTTSDVAYGYHSLPSTNYHSRQILLRHLKNMTKLNLNNSNELVKCLVAQLPISSQSYTITPYLDHSLFSYDEKLVSNFERPKAIGDQVIRFYNRDTEHLAFKIYPGLGSSLSQSQNTNINATNSTQSQPSNLSFSSQQTAHNTKRLVAFMWHPREPFCISVQRTSNEYNVNFHVFKRN